MKQALDAATAEKRKPTEADRPPLSTFPLTPAAKAARVLSRSRFLFD
jgi:hypothetical protein